MIGVGLRKKMRGEKLEMVNINNFFEKFVYKGEFKFGIVIGGRSRVKRRLKKKG